MTSVPAGTRFGRGVIALGAASTLIAVTNVAFAGLAQRVDPVVLTFAMAVVAGVVFQLVNRQPPPKMTRHAWWVLTGLNVASAGVYLFLIIGLKYLEPAVGAALQAGATPLMTILVTGVVKGRLSATGAEWAGVLVVLAGSVLLGWTSLEGISGVGSIPAGQAVLGICAVVLSGLSTVVLTLCARRLSALGWANTTVLAHRFYFTSGCCALLLMTVVEPDWSAAAELSVPIGGFCVLTAVVLLLLQIGIRNVAPLVVLTMTNLNPILAYGVQLVDHRLHASMASLAGIVVIVAGVLGSVHVQRRALSAAHST